MMSLALIQGMVSTYHPVLIGQVSFQVFKFEFILGWTFLGRSPWFALASHRNHLYTDLALS